MRYICMAILALFGAVPLSHKSEPPQHDLSASIELRCKINQIEVEERRPSYVEANLKVSMQLVNTGSTPIILLRGKPTIPGGYLMKDATSLSPDNILNSTYFGPSFDNSPKWASLHAALDLAQPPPDLTRILMPNDSWSFKGDVHLLFAPSSDPFRKQKNFKEICNSSPVWLRVICDVWPFNVEPLERDETAAEKLPFGHMLQQRWSKIGRLWINSIESEPVLIDLRNASRS